MNTLKKKANGYVPVSNFSGLVNSVFPSNVNRILDDSFWGFNGIRQQVHVPVNIRETSEYYELELVAPGLKKEDLNVNINQDVLTIGYHHEGPSDEHNKQEGWLRREYNMRSFARSFDLEEEIDTNKITAKYADGILRVTLPKKDGGLKATRTIDIQ